MFTKRKRDVEENAPLKEKLKEVISQLGGWEDACGGRYTVECNIKVGDDYIDVEVFGLDDFDLKQLSALVKKNKSIASYKCVLPRMTGQVKGHMCLTFENGPTDESPNKIPKTSDDAFKKMVDAEFLDMKKKMTTENEGDVMLAAKCFACVKIESSALVSHMLTVSVTSTPGLITLVLTGVGKLERALCERLMLISEEGSLKVIINLEKGYLQFNISKRRSTVNI
jgi:hypothetical protein